MSLAKVRKDKLIQYPYGFAELQADNPYSDFGGNRDVAALFAKTEAAERGERLVEVQSGERPDYDPATQYLTEGAPDLVGKVWATTWTVQDRPPPSDAEIAAKAQAEIETIRTEALDKVIAADPELSARLEAATAMHARG
jgi:hypothetical protein